MTALRHIATVTLALNILTMIFCHIGGDEIGFLIGLTGAALAGVSRIYAKEAQQAMPGYRESAMRLRYEISQGEYPAGTRLPSHTDLARMLGTTRTTIRRAIELLADEGLIHVIPGRGTFVAGETPDTSQRSRIIEHHIRQHAQLGLHIEPAESLANAWSVSPSTARRVLARLVAEGVIQRTGRSGYEAP